MISIRISVEYKGIPFEVVVDGAELELPRAEKMIKEVRQLLDRLLEVNGN